MSYHSLWKICYSYIYIRSSKAKYQNKKESLIEEKKRISKKGGFLQ